MPGCKWENSPKRKKNGKKFGGFIFYAYLCNRNSEMD